MEYEFKCPNPGCSGNRLNEIMVNVIVDSEIDRITDDDGIVYGDQTNGDGDVLYFCCRVCGILLTTDGTWCRDNEMTHKIAVTTHEELIQWLKSKNCG